MKRILNQYATGYVFAVLSAVLVTEFLIFAPTIFPDGGKFGSFYSTLNQTTNALFSGVLFTAITALPGYAVTLIVAKKLEKHSPYFYCFCGMLTALSAHGILWSFIGQFFPEAIQIILCSVPGGAAGAYAYYRWRLKTLSI